MNDLLEALKKRKSDAQKESAMSLIASGAAELLSGDTGGEIADYGGKLAQSRMDIGDKAEDKMTDYQMALAKTQMPTKTQGKRFQAVPVEDDKGNIVYKTFDTYQGTMEDKPLGIRGFSPFMAKDPTTGQIGRAGKGRADQAITPVRTKGVDQVRTVKEEKDVRDSIASLEKDPDWKSAKKAMSTANVATRLLRSGNDVADEGIKTIFPRMFGEVGNLAWQEQERFSGSPALKRKWRTFLRRYQDEGEGAFSARDRSDLLQIAQIMQNYYTGLAKDLAESRIKSEKAISGSDPRSAIEPLLDLPKIQPQSREHPKMIEGRTIRRMYKGKPATFRKTREGWELVQDE